MNNTLEESSSYTIEKSSHMVRVEAYISYEEILSLLSNDNTNLGNDSGLVVSDNEERTSGQQHCQKGGLLYMSDYRDGVSSVPQPTFTNTSNNMKEETENFMKLVAKDKFAPGNSSLTEKYIFQLLETKGKEETFNWLSKVYGSHCDDSRIAIGILQIISHIGDARDQPSAQFIATNALLNSNTEVDEYGIRCFENWEDKRFIPTLKMLHYEQPWLNEYLNGVIEDLAEED